MRATALRELWFGTQLHTPVTRDTGPIYWGEPGTNGQHSWVQHKRLRIIVVFEGRDAAGNGGVIKCLTERVSLRVFRVVALPALTEREASQLHIQRYVTQFPAAGEVVIFDRSWYNRAGVERVMGFCPESEVQRFLLLVPLTERVTVESGIIIIKYWFEASQKEQTRRFKARIDDGRKIWKLSPMDLESHRRWYDYSRAGRDVAGDRYSFRTLVRRQGGRQAPGAPELHRASAHSDSVQGDQAPEGEDSETAEAQGLRRARESRLQDRAGTVLRPDQGQHQA
jgi:hypothetical protein